jgi:putative transposase
VARQGSPYPSDLTNEQWELMQRVVPEAKPGGRPRSVDMREVVNALLYLNRSGCIWRMLPHDFPPRTTVYEYFLVWRNNGIWQLMLDVLQEGYREVHPKRRSNTGEECLDSQIAKPTEQDGECGFDAGRSIADRNASCNCDPSK